MKKQDGMKRKEHITRQQAWDSSSQRRMNGADYWLKGGYTGMMYDQSLFFTKVYCIK